MNVSKSKISIIMGIYNCAKTLPEAIDSILAQTYSNWELIMCDDGSSDDTYAIAEKYKITYPNKIKLIKNEKNLGLNATLNMLMVIILQEWMVMIFHYQIDLKRK